MIFREYPGFEREAGGEGLRARLYAGRPSGHDPEILGEKSFPGGKKGAEMSGKWIAETFVNDALSRIEWSGTQLLAAIALLAGCSTDAMFFLGISPAVHSAKSFSKRLGLISSRQFFCIILSTPHQEM